MSICPESGLPCPGPCVCKRARVDYEELAKIQPEEVYRAQPMDFTMENAMQALVGLYALAYGALPLDRWKPGEEDRQFWAKVDEVCAVGERLQAGEQVSRAELPKLSRPEAQRMFHIVMQSHLGILPPQLALPCPDG